MVLHNIAGTHYQETAVQAIQANALQANVAAFIAPFRCRVVSVEFLPLGEIAVESTENSRRLSVHQGEAKVAVLEFQAGQEIPAGALLHFALSGEIVLDAHGILLVETERLGTGLALPRGVLRVGFQSA